MLVEEGRPDDSHLSDPLRRQVMLVGSRTSHRWTLEQAEEAYRLFDTQTTGKAVILPS